MTKCSIFIGILSHVGLVAFQLSIASVSLGIDTDTGAVVGRADEFDAGAGIVARRSKTDQTARGRIVFLTTASTCVLRDWLSRRGSGRFLFGPAYGDCVLDRQMNPVSVQRAIKRSMMALGRGERDHYTGHALRVGAAQDLLYMCRDTAGIMRAGGWKSISTLARYLEVAQHNVWE